MNRICLVYIRSLAIVDFLDQHPIHWGSRDLARLGGYGDQAGVTPTPAIEEFLRLLMQTGNLFTQEQYAEHCFRKWASWLTSKPRLQQLGVRSKLTRNFYPSCIDALHVWAIISEAGWFNVCVWDAYRDVLSKVDLILKNPDREIKVALVGPRPDALTDYEYKQTYRNGSSNEKAVMVRLPEDRWMSPGNKRWYRLEDFAFLAPPGQRDWRRWTFSDPGQKVD